MDERIPWVWDQMTKAKIPQTERWVIEQLLKVYWEEEKSQKLSTEQAETITKAFSELVVGHHLVPDETEGVWIQARPGALVIRDTVRVKADGYAGEVGLVHNGKTGVIVAIRYGDIHVRYEDGTIARHSPHALEKRVG